MSIWSSFGGIEPLREGQYGADIDPDSYLDLADTGLRGRRGDLLRLVIYADKVTGLAVLDRKQATDLRDQLTAWFDRTQPGEQP